MKNKKLWLGIVALVFGLFLTGCGDLPDSSGYAFEFRVNNTTSGIYVDYITKIEFINGSNESANVLQTEVVNIGPGEMSSVYKISGFTEKEGSNRIFGIRLTYDDGKTAFKYSNAADKSKIRVVSGIGIISSKISFAAGNW